MKSAAQPVTYAPKTDCAADFVPVGAGFSPHKTGTRR